MYLTTMFFSLLGITLACPGKEKSNTAAVSIEQNSGMAISVGGISCLHCVETIIKSLKSLEEIAYVKYNAKDDVFHVVIKDGYTFDEKRIKEAVEKVGYTYKGLKKLN
ncbi:MAG: heavy-metal-associated domain-containing protein [candidate division WOR-3 bacterium]|nr:heavy-metal-associated domain-containing protein [candidate division WOR-3 bacterium]MCX7948165.1 heavy-metal-associated domain-containing protein [candidate division WOR-3 bacterium]MDW8151026.1 heavy-metal-associated domain-containing protein [candidate division WOR-3 bacterium]